MRTKEDEKRMKRDMAHAAEFLDSPAGKELEKAMNKVQKELENERDMVVITDCYIQQDAETILDRYLTKEELEEVAEKIREDLSAIVQDNIRLVVDFGQLVADNRDAGKMRPNYQVYWKNPNAYHSEFSLVGAFKTEKEARAYIDYRGTTYEEVWKIVLVDPVGFETEIPYRKVEMPYEKDF